MLSLCVWICLCQVYVPSLFVMNQICLYVYIMNFLFVVVNISMSKIRIVSHFIVESSLSQCHYNSHTQSYKFKYFFSNRNLVMGGPLVILDPNVVFSF